MATTTDTTSTDVHAECETDDLVTPRIIICILLGIVGLFCLLPFHSKCKHTPGKKPSKGKALFYSVMACFAAGMLISIALVHIMPEATALYNAYGKEGSEDAHAGHDDHGCEDDGAHDDHADESTATTTVDDPNDGGDHSGHNHRIL